MSCSIPSSSAMISLAGGRSPPNTPRSTGIEEEHRVRTERAVRAARLQEMHRRRREAAQLDLARDALDEVVSLVDFDLAGQVHARNLRWPGADATWASSPDGNRRGRRRSLRVVRVTARLRP